MEVKNKYLQLKWNIIEITKSEQLKALLIRIRNKEFDLMGLDTETSGLHIILDKPFCVPFALVNTDKKIGYAFITDIRDKDDLFLSYLQLIIEYSETLLLWNAKYDTHMMANIDIDIFKCKKVIDVMIYARLATDAVPPSKGGPKLSLKAFTKKYIDPNADDYQKEISALKKEILIKRNTELKKIKVSIGKLNEFLDDLVNEIDDLDEDIKAILKDPQYDQDDYRNIPWDSLKMYAAYDVIYTVEDYLYCLPIVKQREQLQIAEMETKLIPILFKMERVGFKLNKFYLVQTKHKVKEYLIQQREKLCKLAGESVKVGQHEKIKQIFKNKFNIELEKSDEDALDAIVKLNVPGSELAKIIIELRTLEKWYSTYICKWLTYADRCDRVYTSFNQVGAVSGRFSSDFQQFPKDAIYKDDGEVLFIPRRIIQVSNDSNYKSLCYIDFSAEELRIQAAYTILIGHPDVNLCRAFIPFKCDPNTWKPTDLHSLTTLKAFPELTEDHPEFKHYRYIGKRANFCMNYGGTKAALMSSLGVSEETASKLYNAYKQAYPGVQRYKEYVNNVLSTQDYITNLFGRRYYNAAAHNCCNYLIQGSGADLLKNKLIELDKFLSNYNSRIVCTIHDEIVFEIYEGEEFVIPKLKEIMETFEELPIPLKSEVEITTTTWDAKKGIEV